MDPTLEQECLVPTLKNNTNRVYKLRTRGYEPGAKFKMSNVPICTDDDFFFAMVTKWRGYDYASVYIHSKGSNNNNGDNTNNNNNNANDDNNPFPTPSPETDDLNNVKDLHTNLPQLPHIAPIERLSDEQLEFTTYVTDLLAGSVLRGMRVLALTGPAGAGKTKCLDALKNFPSLYVTCKGQLVQDINRSCHVTAAMTWAKLGITLTGLSYVQWILFAETVSCIIPAMRSAIFKGAAFTNLPLASKFTHLLHEFKIIYIDEFSMLNYGEVVLVLELLKKYNVNAIVVLVGDPAQIPPIRCPLGEENAQYVIQLAEREFVLKRAMRFVSEEHARTMHEFRSLLLKRVGVSKLAEFVDRTFSNKLALYPRFDLPLFYPKEPPPKVTLQQTPGGAASILENGTRFESKTPPIIDFMLSQQNQKPKWTNFYIKNAAECLDWIDRYQHAINSFVCYHVTNLNVHLGALSFSRALHEVCGVPVKYAKIFTIIQTLEDRRPFFGVYQTDRVQLLPLIVGHQYYFMDSASIIKRGAKLILVHVEVEEGNADKCKFLIMLDEYRVFFKISPTLFNLPLFCSNHKNYTANYPKEVLDSLKGDRMFEVYGFPLMLSCFSNIYQSQGATIAHQDVYLNLSGCSGAEMYVGLSRCKRAEQIKSIILYGLCLI